MAIAMLLLLLVVVFPLRSDGGSHADHNAEFLFPRALHILSVDIREPRCEDCRIVLYAVDLHSCVQQTRPSRTVVFTNLEVGSYHLIANCSSVSAVCEAEPTTLAFSVPDEFLSGITSVGQLTLTAVDGWSRRLEEVSARPEKLRRCMRPELRIVGILAVLLLHWLGLRIISLAERRGVIGFC